MLFCRIKPPTANHSAEPLKRALRRDGGTCPGNNAEGPADHSCGTPGETNSEVLTCFKERECAFSFLRWRERLPGHDDQLTPQPGDSREALTPGSALRQSGTEPSSARELAARRRPLVAEIRVDSKACGIQHLHMRGWVGARSRVRPAAQGVPALPTPSRAQIADRANALVRFGGRTRTGKSSAPGIAVCLPRQP